MATSKLSDIQVAILAGGYGTRLKEMTQATPKPMVQVFGKPFLEYILKWVFKSGLRRFVLMVGHLGHVIEDYFGDGKRWDMDICYSYESPPAGTAGALKKAGHLLEDHFLLLNGDTFLPIDYQFFSRTLLEARAQAIMAAYNNFENVAPNNLSFSSDNIVTYYGEGTSASALTHVDAGAYGFKKETIQQLPSNKIINLGELYPRLIANSQLLAYPVKQRYYDIGTLERLETFKENISAWVKTLE